MTERPEDAAHPTAGENDDGARPRTEPEEHRRSRIRTGVRILGWLLILGAVGIGGFLLQQQWSESAANGREQDRLADRFEERTSQARQGSSPEIGPRVADGQTSASITVPEQQTALTDFQDRDDVPVLLAGDDDGIALAPADPSPDLLREWAPPEGDALGRIEIPSIGVDWMVVEGVSAADLRRAPGHMPGTAIPGQIGNAVISGHRTTNGAPFGDLDRLEPGDEIIVETVLGAHTFEVIGSRIVAPTELWVASQWAGSWLTLTTCHPKHSAAQRLIVFAHLAEGPNADVISSLFPGPHRLPEPG